MPATIVESHLLKEETQRLLKQYASGSNLLALTILPGWEEVLTILKEDIEKAAKKLRTYREADPYQSLRLLSELQGKESALSTLEAKVRSLTALANDPPAILQHYINH